MEGTTALEMTGFFLEADRYARTQYTGNPEDFQTGSQSNTCSSMNRKD
jgi:hypothetical protein